MKTTPKIEFSNRYTDFESNHEQRSIKSRHVSEIIESMRTFGFLPSKPVQCYKKGRKFIIIDGHHRYEAAKALGIELAYIVEPESNQATIGPVNVIVSKWGQLDFVRMYAARNNPDFAELLKYHEMGIPVGMAASMLIGNSAASGNTIDSIKHGTFKIKTRKYINHVIDLVDSFGDSNSVYLSRAFMDAFTKCLFTPQFDLEQFKKRIAANPLAIEKTATSDKMLDQIEKLYNRKSQTHIPLGFLVREKARERQVFHLSTHP
jgi:hypothetical protein